jgi:hypothetical protein
MLTNAVVCFCVVGCCGDQSLVCEVHSAKPVLITVVERPVSVYVEIVMERTIKRGLCRNVRAPCSSSLMPPRSPARHALRIRVPLTLHLSQSPLDYLSPHSPTYCLALRVIMHASPLPSRTLVCPSSPALSSIPRGCGIHSSRLTRPELSSWSLSSGLSPSLLSRCRCSAAAA